MVDGHICKLTRATFPCPHSPPLLFQIPYRREVRHAHRLKSSKQRGPSGGVERFATPSQRGRGHSKLGYGLLALALPYM